MGVGTWADYRVVVRPSLEPWSSFNGDFVVLRRMDVNNLRVISSVLGQTVALYHYEQQVETMLEMFSDLNAQTEQTGNFKMTKKQLFQLVAQLNKMMVDIVTKIGLLKRSDTAWNYAQYGQVRCSRAGPLIAPLLRARSSRSCSNGDIAF